MDFAIASLLAVFFSSKGVQLRNRSREEGGGGGLYKIHGRLFPFVPQAPILYAVIFFENSFVAHESQYFKGEGAPGLIDCVSFQNSFYKGRVRIPRPPLYRVFPSSLQLIQNIVLTIFY